MLACAQHPKDSQQQFPLSHSPATAVTAATAGVPLLAHANSLYNTQNDLLLHKVLRFYNENNGENMNKMLSVINGTTNISLRIMDWFVTNYSKKHYTVYELEDSGTPTKRFKVYVDYKLKLRAYSKKRFDPFCRWDRINVPHKNGTTYIQTTLGQLNFFKWAIENQVLRYIHENYSVIETDMNIRNNTSRKMAKSHQTSSATVDGCEIKMTFGGGDMAATSATSAAAAAAATSAATSAEASAGYDTGASSIASKIKQRKKREELSSSATKGIKKEFVDIVITFD